MELITSILSDFISFFSVKTTKGKVHLAILILLIVAGVLFLTSRKDDVEQEPEALKVVYTSTASDVVTKDGFTLVGNVESQNQVRIQTEVAGRVVRVKAELGDELVAGQVIAELENASEYASLLQAEGVYESALAVAAQSDISVESAQISLSSAKNTALNTYRSSYTTVNSIVLETLDEFYSDPTANIVGVRIDTNGQSGYLVSERKALNSILANWQNNTITANSDSDIELFLSEAKTNTSRVINLIDNFINLTANAPTSETLSGVSVNSYTSDLNAARASLNSVLASISSTETSLAAVEETLRQAQIGGTSSNELSTANAQVKQALGSLRAAQANYEKTIIRTPIAGTLNELSLKQGDFVNQFQRAALVANNNALVVTTYVGENDAARMSVGQKVLIENNIEGVVTAIAPGIDSLTKKTEVKIGTESTDLQTGDTVNITFSLDDSSTIENQTILVPITALRFTSQDGYIFLVTENKLNTKPVVVGKVIGSYVEVLEGIDWSTEFVIDSRGLTEGLKVEAVRK